MKISTLLTPLTLAATLLAGPAAAQSFTLTDVAGREVTFDKPVERVILGEGRMLYSRFPDKSLVIAGGRMHACGPSSEVITVDMLRQIYRIEARIEECSRRYRHVIVDGTALSPHF